MRLIAGHGPLPPSTSLEQALQQAVAGRGHAPAVTVIDAAGRHEQGLASLAQWTAKGAHLLASELGLTPGEVVAIDAPASWTVAAVALAAWWNGLGVTVDRSRFATASLVVRGQHDAQSPDDHRADTSPQRTLWLGGHRDGLPDDPALPSWTAEAQWMPDVAPPAHQGDQVALIADSGEHTLAQLMDIARQWPPGTLGVISDALDVQMLTALAIRPVTTGFATVVVDGVDVAQADGDRVAFWLNRR